MTELCFSYQMREIALLRKGPKALGPGDQHPVRRQCWMVGIGRRRIWEYHQRVQRLVIVVAAGCLVLAAVFIADYHGARQRASFLVNTNTRKASPSQQEGGNRREPSPSPPYKRSRPQFQKVNEIPLSAPRVQAPTVPVSALFLLADGRRIEANNYTLTDQALFIYQRAKPATRVPLEQLDLEATLAANRQRGINLRIPQSGSEIYIGFR
jgi:hypothetical protein